MTPINAFIVDEENLTIYTQDFAGQLTKVGTCPNQEQLAWLVNSLTGYHRGVPVMKAGEHEVLPN